MSARWTAAEHDLCRSECAAGAGWEERVCAQLPQRTLDAIKERAVVLGLPQRGRGGKPPQPRGSDGAHGRFTRQDERLRLSRARLSAARRRQAAQQ